MMVKFRLLAEKRIQDSLCNSSNARYFLRQISCWHFLAKLFSCWWLLQARWTWQKLLEKRLKHAYTATCVVAILILCISFSMCIIPICLFQRIWMKKDSAFLFTLLLPLANSQPMYLCDAATSRPGYLIQGSLRR